MGQYPSPWANMTHALSVVGTCAFVAMIADPGVDVPGGGGGGLIYVFDTESGAVKFTINP